MANPALFMAFFKTSEYGHPYLIFCNNGGLKMFEGLEKRVKFLKIQGIIHRMILWLGLCLLEFVTVAQGTSQ